MGGTGSGPPKLADHAERMAYIARRLVEGASQKDIAAELGLTKQRVHQIVSDMPLPCRCGCGGSIPAGTDGHRIYLDGHQPVERCEVCQGTVSTGNRRCLRCFHERAPIEDLTGRRFGRWTVIGLVTPGSGRLRRRWWCRCECGRERPVPDGNLIRGLSTGCAGCGYAKRRRRTEPSP